MRFQPKSEEEIDTRVLLKPGEYSATVTQATDERSKSSGVDQIHIVLKVEDEQGQRNTVHDYLLEAMAGKLRHFCIATGLLDLYEQGELTAADCTNQDVRVRLGVEKGNDQYQDKNVVKDYLAKPASNRPAPTPNPTSSGEAAAKKAFLVVWNRFIGEFPAEAPNRDKYWKRCFDGFFPGKLASALTSADWQRFIKEVPKWGPISGWPAKEALFGNEQQFQEDDIPF